MPLQARQPSQGQGQHGPGLALGQTELRLQLVGRGLRVGRRADRLDHLVEVVEADLQALENVRPFLRFLQVELRAPHDDIAAVVDEELQRLLQAQHHRPSLDDRQHDHAERLLQRGVLVEVVEHGVDLRLALQLDDDAHALPVGFVAQVGDAFELSFVCKLGDLRHQRGLVHGVRKLVDDDPLAAVLRLLERVPRAHDDAPVAGRVSGLDACGAHDQAAGRKVRSLDEAQQVLAGRFGVVDQVLHARGDLAQVVRRDVCGHADGDPGGPVDEQVRDARGQHSRLFVRAVVVRDHVDRLLLDVRHKVAGDRRQPGLGVPHGSRRVAVDAAEVALPIDQRIAQREGLRHAHERVIHGRVAVRVVEL